MLSVIRPEVGSLIDSALDILRKCNQNLYKQDLIIEVNTLEEMHLIYAYFLERYSNDIIISAKEPLFYEQEFNEHNSYMYTFKIFKNIYISLCFDGSNYDFCDYGLWMECFILDLRTFDLVKKQQTSGAPDDDI